MQPNLCNIERSRALLKRSDVTIIRGCQGHKRSHDMLAMGYPVFTRGAAGARFLDVDGNEYLDYLLGFGVSTTRNHINPSGPEDRSAAWPWDIKPNDALSGIPIPLLSPHFQPVIF